MVFFQGWKTKVDEGVSVHYVGPFTFEYRDGDRRLLVETERLGKRPNRLIFAQSIKQWEPPHETEPISDEKRHEIATKVGQFFRNNGKDFEIQW